MTTVGNWYAQNGTDLAAKAALSQPSESDCVDRPDVWEIVPSIRCVSGSLPRNPFLLEVSWTKRFEVIMPKSIDQCLQQHRLSDRRRSSPNR